MKKTNLFALCFTFLFACSSDDDDRPQETELDPAQTKVLLSEFNPQFNNFDYSLIYNDSQLPISITTTDEFGTDYSFTYNPDERIIEQRGNGYEFLQTTKVTYNGNNLSELRYFITNSGGDETHLYNYSDENNYIHRTIIFDISTGTDEFSEYISVERDTQGRITHYTSRDEKGAILNEISIEFSEGNLTRIVHNSNNNDTVEFTYDTQNNFNPLSSYRNSPIPSFPFFGGPSELFYNIPELYSFQNDNNLVGVKINDTTVLTYSYEYDIFDYPIKRKADDGKEWLFKYNYYPN